MRIRFGDGNVFTKQVKAQAPKNYVAPIANKFKSVILNNFGDSFILAMKKHARKRYPEYFT
jgi:hypothetical protein